MRGGNNKEKGRKALAWGSFIFAMVAGAAAATTFIGGLVAGILGYLGRTIGSWTGTGAGTWVAGLVLASAVIALGIDLFIDGEPNQIALYSAMAIPSLANATSSDMADAVTQFSAQLRNQIGQGMGAWLGVTAGGVGLAIACAVVALLMARRVIAKTGGGR